MGRAYVVHSNRDHHEGIDFQRVFEMVGVVATFSDTTGWGAALQALAPGDRVVLYDSPSDQYLAVGVVEAPRERTPITDPDRKVAPRLATAEYHVSVQWDTWFLPGDGYDAAAVDAALGVDASASVDAVRPIEASADTIDGVIEAIVDGRPVGGSLPGGRERIVALWGEVAKTRPAGVEFDLSSHTRTEAIADSVDEFVSTPTPERFEAMWGQLYAAMMQGSAGQILAKWDGSIADLAALVATIRDADTYDPEWEDRLGAKTTVRELFGVLHIDEYPVLNSAAEAGLRFFGYDAPDSYRDGVESFESFLDVYERLVGHVTRDADHDVRAPIRYEIDQLFNVIDKVDEASVAEESSDAAIELYEAVLAAKRDDEVDSDDAAPGADTAADGQSDPDYYWISANPSIWSVEEIADGSEVFYTAYNQAGNKRRLFDAFQSATPGDRVVFYESTPVKAVVAEGTIVEGYHEEPYETHDDPVAGVTIRYDRPVDQISWAQLTDIPDLAASAPIRNGAQGSLFPLTAAEYEAILALESIEPDHAAREPRYFWLNADEATWDGPGDRTFYATTAPSGSDRLNQAAYERAQSGDEVLVYRLSPEQRIVGRARVVRGLHRNQAPDGDQPLEQKDYERDKDGDNDGSSPHWNPDAHEDPVEGITVEWVEALDGPAWERVSSDPELADCTVVTSDNHYVLTELTREEFDRLLELGESRTYADYRGELAIPTEEITVPAEGLYFPADEWERISSRIERALASGDNVLLFGPPGTGKTKLARRVCAATVGSSNHELVTASADWSTFDTVGGYQSTADNTLEFRPGVVLDRFRADADGTPANEWLVIDELNRADIDKAFGSLFSALTGERVTLPFDGPDGDPIELLNASHADESVAPNRFFIPEDWRMLATMNTLDKTSLYEMSYAFMRRWAFVPVGVPDLPDPAADVDADVDATGSDAAGPADDSAGSPLAALVGEYVAVWTTDDPLPAAPHHYERVGRIWRAVNEHRPIGPAIVEDIYAYVARADSVAAADYASPIVMYVFPQLEGLRRGDLERVLDALADLVDDAPDLWRTARDFFQLDVQPGGGTRRD